MPTNNNGNGNGNNTTTEIKWFGDEVLFRVGEKDVKIWHVIVGLILLSLFLPFFRKRKAPRRSYRPRTPRSNIVVVK